MCVCIPMTAAALRLPDDDPIGRRSLSDLIELYRQRYHIYDDDDDDLGTFLVKNLHI